MGTTEHNRLRDELASLVRGRTEVRLEIGIADVVTTEAVFEVEPARYWRMGMMQALAYGAELQLPPILAVFGDEVSQRRARDWGARIGIMVWQHVGGLWIEPTTGLRAFRRCRLDPIIRQPRYGLRMVR